MLNPEAASGTADTPAGRVASFGKYLLLQRVSVGGMAEIFKAIPEGATRIDQIVAIKRILPNIAEDREFIGMFIDEARIAGQLTHPNICRIYELGRVGADHYIAMQFLWGRDLLKVMNRYKRAGLLLPPPMAALIAAEAASALHYAHNKCDAAGNPLHIIHRDVSPQNIVVGYSGQTKLIDFGVARAASQSQKTQAGILKGKFGYMSPEMIRGLPVDHRSDVFAMGICLHEALTGTRLFYGETDFATLELVRDAKISPPSSKAPGVVPALDAIVMKALSRDAEHRYQSAQELTDALMRFLDQHYPGYGEKDVGASMREAFAHELSREKVRLDSFASMLARGALVRGAALPALPSEPPPSGERPPESKPDAFPDSQVPAASSAGLDTEYREEQTQIFFSAAELSELRHLDAQISGRLQRPPQASDVIMRASSGLTAPPPAKAPSLAGPTPSGTYPKRDDERARTGSGTPARRNERAVQTQSLPVYRPTPSEERAMQAGRAPRSRQHEPKHKVLLIVAACAVAGLGYSLVRIGAQRNGKLVVAEVSDPDALVRVDGVVRGNPPLSIEDIGPGVHQIDIEADGYETARAKVAIEPGTTRRVQLELKRLSAPVVAALPGAPSAPTAQATKVRRVPPLGAPSHALRARAETGSSRAPEDTSEAAPDMPQLPSAPSAGDEGAQAPGPEARSDEAPGGAGSTAAEENAGDTAESAPNAGETQVGDSINQEALAASEGELLISTVPWARVIIDGVDTGRDTPVRALRVPAGDHFLVLRTPDGADHPIPISIVAGKTMRIIRRF